MPRVTGVLETCIHVEDVARSAQFYESLFGFPRLGADERFCAFDVGGHDVLILFRRGGYHGTGEAARRCDPSARAGAVTCILPSPFRLANFLHGNSVSANPALPSRAASSGRSAVKVSIFAILTIISSSLRRPAYGPTISVSQPTQTNAAT